MLGSGFPRRAAMVAAIGAIVGPVPAPLRAQGSKAMRRIGLLSFGQPGSAAEPREIAPFDVGLREQGLTEGRNVAVERRYGLTRQDLIAAANELVRMNVDVLVAGGPGPLNVALAVAQKIPIVAVSGGDPVGEGWARSLAHPGGNVTGLTVTYPELLPKRLEILKEALPKTNRVAVFHVPAELVNWSSKGGGGELLQIGARDLGVDLLVLPLQGQADIAPAFGAARRYGAQALIPVETNLVVEQRHVLAALAIEHRLASISGFPLMAEAGFLFSYGADLGDLWHRAAGYVARILAGARAGDLPIERPAKLRLVVNRKTAAAIGATIAQPVLLRADELIG